jgi:protein TonB
MEVIMFATLLESGTTLRRRPGTVSLSAVLHIAFIAGGVVLSPRRAIEKPIVDLPGRVVYIDPLVRVSGQLAHEGTSGGLPITGPRFPLPNLSGIDIVTPSGIEATATDAAAITGTGGGSVVAGGGAPDGDAIYSAALVDKSAIALPGNRTPVYPELLRKAGVEGSVLVQFIIDTTGALEPESVRIIKSDHELFSHAVRAVLDRHRFLPAEAGGHRVRMLVQQWFEFEVQR